MGKHNRQLAWLPNLLLLTGLMWALSACESLEGERLLVPAAHVSLFVPANWESNAEPHGAVVFEATPRGMKTVKLQVLVEPEAPPDLEDMQKRALKDVAELAKKTSLDVQDVTQIPQKRGHIKAVRFVHQLSMKRADKPFELTHIADLIPTDGKAVVVLVLGPKAEVDAVSAELDRILSSVRSLTPEPETPRVYPPDAVTGASQRMVVEALKK